jgi:hypothetical protein
MDTPTDVLKGRRNRATPRRSTGVSEQHHKGNTHCAPAGFGALGGSVWINFRDGHIDAYNPMTGEFIDKARDAHGKAIVIDGLWSIKFGNGCSADAQFPQAASELSQPVGHLALLFAFPFSRRNGEHRVTIGVDVRHVEARRVAFHKRPQLQLVASSIARARHLP